MAAYFPAPSSPITEVSIVPDIYTTIIDEVSATVMYIGRASPGTLSSSATWQIRRLTSSGGDLAVEWAASGAFTQIWDNRAALSYS